MSLKTDYKLLVLDIDGTLTNSQKDITEKTRQAIAQAQDNGVVVVLASGRPTYGVLPVARQLKLEEHGGFVLSFNGGCIMNCETGETIYQKTLPPKTPAQLYQIAKKHGVAILTYENEEITTEDSTDFYVQKESQINRMEIHALDDFCGYVDFPVTKCLLTGDGDYLAGVELAVKAEVGDSLSVFRSEPFFLEVMPRNIDKAYALEKLLAHLSLDRSQMIACGDGFNDASMLRFAGLGVAMGNAQEAVKEVADEVTLTNDEDGVAEVICRYLL